MIFKLNNWFVRHVFSSTQSSGTFGIGACRSPFGLLAQVVFWRFPQQLDSKSTRPVYVYLFEVEKTSKMDEVLSELNFDEGIAMPVANAENKLLESQVRAEN